MAFVDGSVVDGRIVVILPMPGRGAGPDGESSQDGGGPDAGAGSVGVSVDVAGDKSPGAGGGGGDGTPSGTGGGGADAAGSDPSTAGLSPVHEPSQDQLAEAQADALTSAADSGAPLCADCEQANDKLAEAEKAAW